MAPRKPATASEVADLLTAFFDSEWSVTGAVAAPLKEFLSYATARLHTTSSRARRWVQDVAVAADAPVTILSIRHGGFSDHLVREDRTGSLLSYRWQAWDGFDVASYDATPRIGGNGVPTTNPGNWAHDGADFIVATSALAGMIEAAAEKTAELELKNKADRLAGLTAAEAAHGEGIALLRGLLAQAGIRRSFPFFEVRYNPDLSPKPTMSTSVSLTFYGEQLDALAPVLRELGVKPRYRVKPASAEAEATA